MKKSKSSVPRFADRWEPAPPPLARKDGLFATGGLPAAEEPALPAPALVAIAVGKTKEGESLPAKPGDLSAWSLPAELHVEAIRRPTKLGITGTAEQRERAS